MKKEYSYYSIILINSGNYYAVYQIEINKKRTENQRLLFQFLTVFSVFNFNTSSHLYYSKTKQEYNTPVYSCFYGKTIIHASDNSSAKNFQAYV